VRDSGKADLTIILPTLNEGGSIVRMLDSLTELYPTSRIIVMDDGSTDGTVEKVRRYTRINPAVTLVQRDAEDRGLTASIIDGILMAETRHFVVMDADFQHPPEAVQRIVESLHRGSDLVIGVREKMGCLTLFRRLSSLGANKLANLYLWSKRQPRSNDAMSGFFGGVTEYWKKVIIKDYFSFERRGFKVLFDLLKFAPKDVTIDEVVYRFGKRRDGESKLDSSVVLSIMRQCGIIGRGAAAVMGFLLLTMMGRFLTTLIVGTLSTLLFLSMMGMGWGSITIFSTALAFISAVVFLVIATDLFMNRRRRPNTLLLGSALVTIGVVGYMLSLYVVYIVAAEIHMVQAVSIFLGFGLAFGWDLLGCSIPSR